MWTVTKEFSFEAAHSLPHLPEGHKCRNLHGHSYKVVIACSGGLDAETSWVVDYADITAAMEPLLKRLDHQNLNDVMLIHSTAENLAFWIAERIRPVLPSLAWVEVRETEKTNAIYKPR